MFLRPVHTSSLASKRKMSYLFGVPIVHTSICMLLLIFTFSYAVLKSPDGFLKQSIKMLS